MLLHMPFGYGDIGVSGCLSIGSLGMGGSGAGESVKECGLQMNNDIFILYIHLYINSYN